MNISQAGIKAIEGYEGVRLTAYLDSVDVPTIGVGHTLGVKLGDTITQDQADEFLRADLEDAEYAVNKYVTVPLTQGQFDSLTSFVFNLGAGAFKGSTLLADLNAGQYDDAADQLLRWNRAGGQILAGLTKRRISERLMFLTGSP
jgi:lysozyme